MRESVTVLPPGERVGEWSELAGPFMDQGAAERWCASPPDALDLGGRLATTERRAHGWYVMLLEVRRRHGRVAA